MAESKKAAKPVNDVAPAGQTAPDSSAKPVIVTNRPIMKDPMVVEGSNPASEVGSAETIPVKVQSKAELKLDASQSALETSKPAAEAKTDAAPLPEPTEPTAAATEDPASPPADAPTVESEKSTSDAPNPAAIEEAEAAKQAEHDAAIQKLADSKQYYLTINAVEQRKSKRFTLLGVLLSVLLLLAWADIALDAGLIQVNGIKPVTHFFSN